MITEIPLPPEVTSAQVLAAELDSCEADIESGLRGLFKADIALCQVRDRKLFLARGYCSFEQYCRDRWGFSAGRARQICIGAEIAQNVVKYLQSVTSGNALPVPESERQVRPLMALPVAEQGPVWVLAAQTAPNGRITSSHIEATARARKLALGLPVAQAARRADRAAISLPGAPAARPAPAAPHVNGSPQTKDARLREVAERAAAGVRDLLQEIGTADSAVAGKVQGALETLQDLQQHLTQINRFHQAREAVR